MPQMPSPFESHPLENSPDVTIVTPTRNRPALLERALNSILRQTFHRYGVVVVDDGSDDEHAAAYRTVVARFDNRFRLLQPLKPGQKGSGPAVSRNRAIDAGEGRYVAFLDDDDVWCWDDHLTNAVNALERTGAELYCGEMQGFSGDELVIGTWFPDSRPLTSGAMIQATPPIHEASRAAFVNAASHRVVHPNMLVVRRRLIERAGGFLVSLRYAEDTEFVLRLADSVDKVLFCPVSVARYRLPEGNAHSLSMNRLEQDLQTLAAAQHLKATARTAEVRRAASSIESWTLRILSRAAKSEGRRGSALELALQAFVVRPTAGSLRQIVTTLFSPT